MPRDGSGNLQQYMPERAFVLIDGGLRMSARSAWYGMRQRCTNRKNRQWKDYGGRGIKMCFAAFDEFLAEVGERPPGMTIDRIDNNGDYAPGNVRWATRAEQQRNRRNAVFVEIEGEQHRLMDIAKQCGLKRDVIAERAAKGLSRAEVLSPQRRYNLTGLALGGNAFGAKMRSRTHCRKGHEITTENTRITPEGWRNCRTCHRLKMRARNLKK